MSSPLKPPFKAYGGNEDIVTDFTRGEDQIDISVYRRDPGTGPGTWKFMAGFFDLLDTDGNGVLDANDARVSVQQVSLNGAAKASIVLDYGNAVLDSGLITTAELAPGPHTLTLYGVATLDRADFVADRSWSDLWGNNSANTLVGTTAGEWLDGRGGNDVLDPRGGDDLVMGGAGNDIFKMVHTLTSPIGRDFVFDFTRGQDKLAGFGDRPDGQRLGVSLALLDSNADGRIDGQDAAVRVQEERYVKPGAASPFALSLVIDWDVAFGRAEEWNGQNSWTLFKVTSLDGNDFLDSGGSFVV
jgi:Ca2+-binding RTX toxin-like protein